MKRFIVLVFCAIIVHGAMSASIGSDGYNYDKPVVDEVLTEPEQFLDNMPIHQESSEPVPEPEVSVKEEPVPQPPEIHSEPQPEAPQPESPEPEESQPQEPQPEEPQTVQEPAPEESKPEVDQRIAVDQPQEQYENHAESGYNYEKPIFTPPPALPEQVAIETKFVHQELGSEHKPHRQGPVKRVKLKNPAESANSVDCEGRDWKTVVAERAAKRPKHRRHKPKVETLKIGYDYPKPQNGEATV